MTLRESTRFEASVSQTPSIFTSFISICCAITVFLILQVFIQPQIASAVQIRSTPRSEDAIRRAKPQLEEALRKKFLEFGSPIFIRIFKESRKLEIWMQQQKTYQHFRTYEICEYSRTLGPKLVEGDKQSPEGFYFVKPPQLKPDSAYHLAINIGFPNEYDQKHKRTGSFIMVHGTDKEGDCVSEGCYSMKDEKIEEIYALADAALRNGQQLFRVHVFPFRMTEENMKTHRRERWFDFWKNLKEGYDYFEWTKRPPNVEVRNGRYVFEED